MKTSDFDFYLPESQIAQKSVEPRDRSRLLIVERNTKQILHRHFYDILEYLRSGDVLVFNVSKVFKARLFGKLLSKNNQNLFEHKKDIELFLVRPMENFGVWKALAKPGKHVQNGMRIEIAPDFWCEVMLKETGGTILVQFPYSEEEVRAKANMFGHIPTPPYVKTKVDDISSYQTIYSKHEGSVAAPTAGFHFTENLLEKIKAKGVEFAEVTLHVGLGTFLPVKSEQVEDHVMHSEWVHLSEENAEKINCAKKEGRRVIAVGTTTVRTLEGLVKFFGENKKNTHEVELRAYDGDINIFITPGFEFQIVSALITNFHLPKSTLLMLVSAFVKDREFLLFVYKQAVEEGYRFFSFGDAMFIE